MDSDKEEYYQVKLALALELGANMGDVFPVIQWNVRMYNKTDVDWEKERLMKSINVLMKEFHGKGWSSSKCGINQHGVWVK